MGGIAIDTTGVPLPEETVDGVLDSDVCYLVQLVVQNGIIFQEI